MQFQNPYQMELTGHFHDLTALLLDIGNSLLGLRACLWFGLDAKVSIKIVNCPGNRIPSCRSFLV
jgi:hypothetical protein